MTKKLLSLFFLCIAIAFLTVSLPKAQWMSSAASVLTAIACAYFLLSKDKDRKVSKSYKEKREEKKDNNEINSEVHNLYKININTYQQLIQLSHFGIILYQKDGSVIFSNLVAKRIFDICTISSIEDISSLNKNLYDGIKLLEYDQGKMVRLYNKKSELMSLTMHKSIINTHNEPLNILYIYDFQSELEIVELNAWQNLIKVLTHEIMNSVGPISSLSETALEVIKDGEAEGYEGQLEDTKTAVEAISRRSKNLMKFVDEFRSLTQVPQPKVNRFNVEKLLQDVKDFMKAEYEKQNIKVLVSTHPQTIELFADQAQIEQVIINLFKNAIQAHGNSSIEKEKKITLTGTVDEDNHVNISVKDNGSGIDEETLERIFVPFFTTKQMGSGIGLSLSRQIMRNHKGNILVRSNSESGSEFILKF